MVRVEPDIELLLFQDALVLFTSDNGPWLIFDLHGGSAGLLRDGKGRRIPPSK